MHRRDAEDAEITQRVIGAAITVHRALGPGLLESAYHDCLCHELGRRKIPYRRQVALPLVYEELTIPCAYRVDVVVDDFLVLELKSVAAFEAVHEAQLLTYMRIGGWPLGLLINFNVPVLRKGIRRRILSAAIHRRDAETQR